MDGMTVSDTDEDPILSGADLRVVSFATFGKIIMPIEEMNPVFLVNRLHAHQFDTFCWIVYNYIGAKLVDLRQIVERYAINDSQLRW